MVKHHCKFDAARQLILTIMSKRPMSRGAYIAAARNFRFLRSTFANEQHCLHHVTSGPSPAFPAQAAGPSHSPFGWRTHLPSQAIRLAVSQQSSRQCRERGHPAALDGAVLEAARQHPELLRTAFSTSPSLASWNYPGEYPHNRMPGSGRNTRCSLAVKDAARRLLHLRADTPVAAAVDVPGMRNI